MDHIWFAPSRLNKSPDLKLGSQWSNILFHSLIVTLYNISQSKLQQATETGS